MAVQEISGSFLTGFLRKIVSYNMIILILPVHGRYSDCCEICTEMRKPTIRPKSLSVLGASPVVLRPGSWGSGGVLQDDDI